MAKHVYKPGSIILFEMGEYSDYQVFAELVALQELDLGVCMHEFADEKSLAMQERGRISYDAWSEDFDSMADVRQAFVAWLCVKQRCAQLECSRVHIGSYDRLELSA